MENQVEILWVGWGMLRLPMGELNLAPRLPGGLLRASLLVGTVIAVTACSRPTGPIAVGLAGPFSQPRGASMLRAAQLAVNQINAKRGIRGRKLELRVVDDSGNEDAAVRVAEQLYADPAIVAGGGHPRWGPSLSAAGGSGGGAAPTPTMSPSAAPPDLSGVGSCALPGCPRGLGHGAELALREMRSLGLRWPVLGGDALTGIEAGGALAEGMRLSSAYLPDRSDERNVAFVADYARAFPGQRPDQRGAGAYDIMLLLARAIDKVGADRKAIRDYLARVGRGQPPFEGVTGPIAFDANGDVAGKTVVIGVVRDGRLVTEVAR